MKKTLFALGAAAGVLQALAVSVTVQKVQQRYPWNGKVDIDYTVAYDEGEASLDVTRDRLAFYAIDRAAAEPVTNLVANLAIAPTPTAAGLYRQTWNANADGVTNVTADLEVFARVTHHVPKYMVVDLSAGKDAASYPVTYLDGEPVGGFGANEYKGSKLVLRLIPAGNYLRGSPSTERGHSSTHEVQQPVMITKPFYIGIYEMTQKQHTLITGSASSSYKGDYRPVDAIAWTTIRGLAWPENRRPSDGSVVGKLSVRTGLKFDLPTEGQWEYACRAGATTPYNDGTAYAANTEAEYKAHLNLLGRYNGNTGDGKGGYSGQHTTVGTYLPNAWGLYDMHGNVCEYCLDEATASANIVSPNVDPIGEKSSAGAWTNPRGGSWNQDYGTARTAARTFSFSRDNGGNPYVGYRVVVNVE